MKYYLLFCLFVLSGCSFFDTTEPPVKYQIAISDSDVDIVAAQFASTISRDFSRRRVKLAIKPGQESNRLVVSIIEKLKVIGFKSATEEQKATLFSGGFLGSGENNPIVDAYVRVGDEYVLARMYSLEQPTITPIGPFSKRRDR